MNRHRAQFGTTVWPWTFVPNGPVTVAFLVWFVGLVIDALHYNGKLRKLEKPHEDEERSVQLPLPELLSFVQNREINFRRENWLLGADIHLDTHNNRGISLQVTAERGTMET